MTEFELYFTQVYNNKIRSSNKMRRISEMLLNQFYCPNEYHYDPGLANKHIEFIEKFCYVPTGDIGQPLKLQLFQKARLQAIFGFVDDNDLRQFNEVLIIEGRKNGKTTECAAIETSLLVNDGEGAPEIYNIATAREQAMKGFNAALNMIKQSPSLSQHVKKRKSDLYFPYNMGFIKALASNAHSLDGLDAHGVIIDELAAIKNRDLYDLMKQSMGARSQPLLFCITTNGFVRDCIFDAQYDYASRFLNGEIKNKRFLPFIYELDDINEWYEEENWIKANPGLGPIKKYSFQKEMVEKALVDASFRPTVLVKDFNMKQTSDSAWLRYETIHNPEPMVDHSFRYGIGGFDAADSIDLNAATVLCMRPDDNKIYRKSMYWLPEEQIKRHADEGKRTGRDGKPYELWISQGWMRTVPGNKVDKKVILEWYKQLRDEHDLWVLYIGYDPWHVDDSLLREFKMEFGEQSMIPVRQGVVTLSQPMKDLEADMSAKRIVYDNPIDEMCLVNTSIRTDINGNIQPIKNVSSVNRIDGTIALICAYKILQDKMDEYLTLI